MKILVICSKNFYGRIESMKPTLIALGHEVYMPNCYDDPKIEERYRAMGEKEHQEFKARMFKQSEDTIRKMDAVLVLNYDKEKDGVVFKNYIGGATFLEMYDAFRMGKKIYLMNAIPDNMLYDEIVGFNPTVLDGNLGLIRESIDEQSIFNPELYMITIEYIMYDYKNYLEDTLANSSDTLDIYKDILKNLHRFYDFLSLNVPNPFKFETAMGKYFKIQHNFVGYEIGYMKDNKVGYKYFVKKVSLTNSFADYYDFEFILNKNVSDVGKRHTITPKEQ